MELKLSRRLLFGTLAVGVIAIGGTVFSLSQNGDKGPQYVFSSVTKGDIDKFILTSGTLKPSFMVNVGTQVNGMVTRIYVRDGQRVKKGQLLVEIDPTLQENELRKAKAELQSALASKRSAQALLTQYEKAFERQKILQENGAGTPSDYDSALSSYLQQKQQVLVSESQIVQAKTSLDTAQANLGYTKITAPADGEVIGILASVGQTVVSSQTVPTILVLADLSRMIVETKISEADISYVKPGQPVYFTVQSDPDVRHTARLDYVQQAPKSALGDQQSQGQDQRNQSPIYYNGGFEVANPDGKLKTAMSAQVYIQVEHRQNVVRVPLSALGAPTGQVNTYYVQVQRKDGVQMVPVKIGVRNSEFAEVLSGLQVGDRVVTNTLVAPGTAS